MDVTLLSALQFLLSFHLPILNEECQMFDILTIKEDTEKLVTTTKIDECIMQ